MRSTIWIVAIITACDGDALVNSPRDSGAAEGEDREPASNTETALVESTCEESRAEVAATDASLGFDASQVLGVLGAAPYASVTWDEAPAGAPTSETLSFDCGPTPERVEIVTRTGESEEEGCPAGPELHVSVSCSLSVEAGSLSAQGTADIGGSSLGALVIGLSDPAVELDASREAWVAGGGAVSSASLLLLGDVAAPVFDVIVTLDDNRDQVAWSGHALP